MEIIMADHFVGFQICLENGEKPTAIINAVFTVIMCMYACTCTHIHTWTHMLKDRHTHRRTNKPVI